MVDKKIIIIPSSQGCLGKNVGCEDGGKAVCKAAGVSYDVAEVSDVDFVETTKKIEKLNGDVFVGGDHSITYGLFKNSGCDSLIIFDAHADCVNDFSPPTHEDFVRVLIEEGHVDPVNIFIVGLRNVDPIEKEYLKDNKIKHHYWGEVGCDSEKNQDFCSDSPNSNTEEFVDLHTVIRDFLKDKERVYLSVDIDALDGEEYVGTGYPEKEGFSLDQLKEFVKDVLTSNKVVRSDLVEVNPSKDKDGETVKAGAEILKILSRPGP